MPSKRCTKALFSSLEGKKRESFEKKKGASGRKFEIEDLERRWLWGFIFLYNTKSS